MLETNVEEIHLALGYTPSDEESLKKVKRIWTQLTKLRQLAATGEKAQLKAYKVFLQQCLGPARTMQVMEELDEITSYGERFNQFYAQELERLNIVQHESGRWPQPHQEWVERHLPKVWEAYGGAVSRWCLQPSKQSFEELKVSATDMLQAYVAAVPRH